MSIKQLSFLLLLLLFVTPATSYQPDPGFVHALLFNEQAHEPLFVGDTANLNVVVKNLTNDTASNFTIIQQFPSGVNVLSIAGQSFDGAENKTGFSALNLYSSGELPVNYLNLTESNYTMNIDTTLDLDDEFAFTFQVNFTTSGQFVFQAPAVSYYDHWPDLYDGQSGNNVIIDVEVIIEDTLSKYVPRAENTEFDPKLFVGGILLVTLVAIISRSLYFKKPIDL